MTTRENIRQLANGYADRLNTAIDGRVAEMLGDDFSHYLIYRVLGISEREGHSIDVYPNRAQAIRIQGTLETLYAGVGGEYYHGDAAWAYVRDKTAIDLKGILEEIADERTAVAS